MAKSGVLNVDRSELAGRPRRRLAEQGREPDAGYREGYHCGLRSGRWQKGYEDGVRDAARGKRPSPMEEESAVPTLPA